VNILPEIEKFVTSLDEVTLGFSTGRDSLCCAQVLRELKVKFTPFYFYQIPDMKFIERSIKMYEDYFETKIIQLPHPMLADYFRHQDFQPPKMINYMARFSFPKLTFERLISFYFKQTRGEDPKLYDVNGMRSAESFNRRKQFEQHGYINHVKRKISLIGNWKKADIMNYIDKNNLPQTDDYKIWNRSFDGMKYQFLFGVKENYPDDWQTILEYFPLTELELKRYEFNRQYWA